MPAAIVGWSFGFGFFLVGLWWVGAAFLVQAEVFAWLMPLGVVGLPAYLALFWAFGAALARLFWSDRWSRILVFAVALSIAEWLRGHLFTGFPWNAVGYALTPIPLMMQSAALVGIWGLTLAACFIFAAPVLLVAETPRSRQSGTHRLRLRGRLVCRPSRLWRRPSRRAARCAGPRCPPAHRAAQHPARRSLGDRTGR